MTLTDFLLARIAEDEEVARSAGDSGPVMHGRPSELVTVHDRDYGQIEGAVEYDSRRVLAECEVKRRMVEREHVECAGHPGPYMKHDDYGPSFCWRADEENATLLDLASIYADHPDYREEWKP